MSQSGPSTRAARSTKSANNATPTEVFAARRTATCLAAAKMRSSERSSRPVVPTRIGMPAAVEARLERGGRGEVDQHVATILVDRKAGIVGNCLGNGMAHAAVRREEADADGLVGSSHGKLS